MGHTQERSNWRVVASLLEIGAGSIRVISLQSLLESNSMMCVLPGASAKELVKECSGLHAGAFLFWDIDLQGFPEDWIEGLQETRQARPHGRDEAAYHEPHPLGRVLFGSCLRQKVLEAPGYMPSYMG